MKTAFSEDVQISGNRYKVFSFLTCLLFVFPLFGLGQGIVFEKNIDWFQLRQKAKQQNKYIFVDCYTTWCPPCKKMDEEVYTSNKAGAYFNENFICVKVQMDKTNLDDSITRSWYKTADMLADNYGVNAYPTFLFFDPSGNPVHKLTGYRNTEAFIQVGNDSRNPEKQYYTLLKTFKPGSIDTTEMQVLAKMYFKQRNTELAEKIIVDYENRQPEGKKFNNDNLVFMQDFASLPFVQALALSYLNTLNKQQFASSSANWQFASKFANSGNKPIRDYCARYLQNLTIKEFSDTSNLKFVATLYKLPEMMPIVENYIQAVSLQEFNQQKNIELAVAYRNSEKLKSLANNCISKYTEKDLSSVYKSFFLWCFTSTSKDPGFLLMRRYPAIIDVALNRKGVSLGWTDEIICKEFLNPALEGFKKTGSMPNWDSLRNVVQHLFDDQSAFRTLLQAKIAWFKTIKDWDTYFGFVIEKANQDGVDTSVNGSHGINAVVWNEFVPYCSKPDQLAVAAKWMEGALRNSSYGNVSYIDTYANVLYKMGKRDEALRWESKAIALAPNTSIFKTTIDKMKKGEPTWILENK
ncbi:MAG: thioredoxin fold domain-containing protein [Bacteroidota bacterium]